MDSNLFCKVLDKIGQESPDERLGRAVDAADR
jgi:hypothetical protein